MSYKLQVDIIDEAIRLMEIGYNRYSCHAISDAIKSLDETLSKMCGSYLTAYTKFSGERLGVPVDARDPWSLDATDGTKWQWWCDANDRSIPAKIENLKLFKEAIARGEVE